MPSSYKYIRFSGDECEQLFLQNGSFFCLFLSTKKSQMFKCIVSNTSSIILKPDISNGFGGVVGEVVLGVVLTGTGP